MDDETSILSSINRVFLDEDLLIEVFDNAQEALDFCRNNKVSVVVSDARMPEMDGFELLGILAEERPETERILLTGHSDIDATIAAINKGRVSYYLEKPWNDETLIRSVQKGVELSNIRLRNQFLEDSLEQKNQQLQEWNESLEKQVQQRSDQLREAYLTSIQSISGMVERRLGDKTPNPRSVAQLCLKIADSIECSEKDKRDLRFAALLCHIGKMTFSDELLGTAFLNLTQEQRDAYCQHPDISSRTILFVPLLADASVILSCHREQFNGKGYPNALKGFDINDCAYVLGISLFYLECRQGLRYQRPYTHQEAIDELKKQQDKMFPQTLVKASLPILDGWEDEQQKTYGQDLTISQLTKGMILAKDLYLEDGLLLLARDKPIDDTIINRLLQLDHKSPGTIVVSVYPEDPQPSSIDQAP